MPRTPLTATRGAYLPTVWSLLLAVILLGPALAPGYVLGYDMVWVPDLALRPDFLGLGSGLPRAVPSDAVVAVLDEVLPGMLLQKLMLVSSLTVAGAGAAALVPGLGVPARCVAASVYVWNPFVVERLVIGHWPVLVGYAALPWLILAAVRLRREGRFPVALCFLVPVASLSASAGLTAAVVVLAFGLSRPHGRANAFLVGLVVAANAPWVVAGLLHAGDATSDPVGAEVFAAQGEGLLPQPLTALGLGGIWNSEVVPDSREGLLAVFLLAVTLLLAAAGLRSWRAACPGRDQVAFAVVWLVGWGIAVLSWVATGVMAWLADNVPGGGLLRDGSRLLGLCAPLLAVTVAHGADRLGRRLVSPAQGGLLIGLLALVPGAFMPDAGWGSSSRLTAADFPASYDEARQVAGDADGATVLLLPFTSFRAPAWNDSHKVLNPLGRYLEPDYLASDELLVSGRLIAGEDSRAEDVRRALDQRTSERRSRDLAALGTGVVVIETDTDEEIPELAGDVRLDAGDLRVIALDDVRSERAPTSWLASMLIAWAAYLGVLITGLVRATAKLTGNKRCR